MYNCIEDATRLARHLRHMYVTPEHVLYALSMNDNFVSAFRSCGGSIRELKGSIRNYFSTYLKTSEYKGDPDLSASMKKALEIASRYAKGNNRDDVGIADIMYGISDIDFVYYDNSDLSYEAEDMVIQKFNNMVQSDVINMDVKNQARVHIWYEERFGIHLDPYQSVEEAINTWPTTASAVGVKLENDNFIVYAPFGLNDMFGQIIRANKKLVTQNVYDTKCKKWKNKWNTLNIITW